MDMKVVFVYNAAGGIETWRERSLPGTELRSQIVTGFPTILEIRFQHSTTACLGPLNHLPDQVIL